MDDKTSLYDLSQIQESLVFQTLNEIYDALEERGYNPINQIVGYLMSGDPGYITSYKDARAKITSISPSKILEVMVKEAVE